MTSPVWRRLSARTAVLAVMSAALAVVQLSTVPQATAATQNGYAFNDPWTLVAPGSAATDRTLPYTRGTATNLARTRIPTGSGDVGVEMQFDEAAAAVPGTSYIQNTYDQSYWRPSAANLAGSPTPSNVPGIGLETNPSYCGGGIGTRAHQNYAGTCEVGTVTLRFDKPVTDPVLDATGVGGYVYRYVTNNGITRARGSFAHQRWTLTSGNATLAPAGGQSTNLSITPTAFGPASPNTTSHCDVAAKYDAGTITESPDMALAGCGSVTMQGTFSAVTFRIDMVVTRFQQYPRTSYHTGQAFSYNATDGYADGQNGLNAVYDEQLFMPGTIYQTQNDMAIYSLRLPVGSIGDTVWSDDNANGVQDGGETGVANVKAELLDKDGKVVATTTTDAGGKYLFRDVAYGDYKVRFTAPDGTTLSPKDQGPDDAKDSDADPVTGTTGTVTIDGNRPNDLTVDAGIVPPPPAKGSVGDFVWSDTDGDGVQDAGEPGVQGVKVELLDADGNVVGTTTTDADGAYLFDGLPLGDYKVRFTAPAGSTLSPKDAGGDDAADSDADPATGETATVTLTETVPDDRDVDAGIVPPPPAKGSVGDFVWSDTDGDGVQDAGEPGVEGVKVELLDADGSVVGTTTTDADGGYLFDGLPLGDYKVRFTAPAGSTLSPKDAGGDDAADSDADPATGETATVTLTEAVPDDRDVDAGVVPPPPVEGSVGDFVWSDTDGDGVQDAGEPGVGGVKVELLDTNGDVVGTTTTDPDGKYLFSDLPLGDYAVQFTAPDGRSFTTKDAGGDDATDSDAGADGKTGTVTLTADKPDVTDVDAGIAPILGSLGDYVWSDTDGDGVQDAGEPGVEGVKVELLDAAGVVVGTTTTDPDGKYLFSDLPLGDYAVQFTAPDGRSFTTKDAGGDDATDSDAGADGKTGTVTLTADKPDVTDVDAGIAPILGSIGDYVWSDTDGDGVQDAGEPGVEGVKVELLDAGGNVVGTTTTDADGAYLFEDLPLGDYTVQFTAPDGREFTTKDVVGDDATDSDAGADGKTSTMTLTEAAPDNRDVDAGIAPILGSIGDTVWSDADGDGVQDAGELGVEGVKVELLDADGNVVGTTTTDADGAYLFKDLPLGDYTVQFTAPDGTKLSPKGAGGDPAKDSDADPATGKTGTVTLSGAAPDNRDVDAGIAPILGSIGDTVWSDMDGDGVQDAGEPGVGGVKVTLLDKDGKQVATTTTDKDGKYLFEDLPLGDYTVEFTAPDGTKLSPKGAGGDPAKDSDADPATGKTGTVTLSGAAPDNRDVDAGIAPILGSIGDTVWSDMDGDGVQDAGEPGVGGVKVTLLDKDGKQVATTTTDKDGKYLFKDLPLGDYTLQFTAPGGTTLSPAGKGGDKANDSDADPATGKTGTIRLTADKPDVTDVDAGLVAKGQSPAPADPGQVGGQSNGHHGHHGHGGNGHGENGGALPDTGLPGPLLPLLGLGLALLVAGGGVLMRRRVV